MTLEIRPSKGKQTDGQAEMHSGAKSRIIRRIELDVQGACSVLWLLDLFRTANTKKRHKKRAMTAGISAPRPLQTPDCCDTGGNMSQADITAS